LREVRERAVLRSGTTKDPEGGWHSFPAKKGQLKTSAGADRMKHYTRSTVEATAYCKKCKRTTRHRVDDRRRGPCLECIARLESEHEKRVLCTPVEFQRFLWGEGQG
jgi:hypothetical protein